MFSKKNHSPAALVKFLLNSDLDYRASKNSIVRNSLDPAHYFSELKLSTSHKLASKSSVNSFLHAMLHPLGGAAGQRDCPRRKLSRITLTYNLYFESAATISKVKVTNEKYDILSEALRQLIDDKCNFPIDGKLCFGLAHQYSIYQDDRRDVSYDLSELESFLMGNDVLIYSACQDVGLDVTLQTLYTNDDSEGSREYLGSDFIQDPGYEIAW